MKRGRAEPTIGSPEDIKRAGSMCSAIIAHLEDIDARRTKTRTETGHSEPRETDLRGCVETLRKLHRPTTKQVQAVLVKYSIHPDVLTYIHANTGVKAEIKADDLKAHIQQACAEAFDTAGMNFQNNGDEFLRNLIKSSVGAKKGIDATHLQRLQQLATELQRKGYPPDEVAAVYILYACLDERSLQVPGRSSHELVLEKLKTMIRAQSQIGQKTLEQERESGRPGTFFTRLLRCVSVYADISQEVIQKSPQLEIANEVRDRATRGLSKFLEREELSALRGNKPAIDPFAVLQAELTERSQENPWIRESLKGTPFDVRKFQSLITLDVPRGLLAESVVALNGYEDWRLARRATSLKNSIQGTFARHEQPSLQVQKQCLELVEDYFKLHSEKKRLIDLGEVEENIAESPELFRVLKEIEDLSAWRSRAEIRKAGDVHAMAALLRIIRPKSIVEDDRARKEFMDLFEEMEKTSVLSTKDMDRSLPEWVSANKRIAIVAASVRDVLADDDPYLDVPISGLPGADERLSLRLMLMRFVHARLDQDVIEKGPYVNLERRIAPDRPLFVPQNLRRLSAERLADLKKNFDTAQGVSVYPDSKNMWTRVAAQAWHRIKPSHFYDQASRFTKGVVQKFFGLSSEYEVAFYLSATSAIGDVVSKLIPIKRGDRVFITNQEYGSITDEFKDREATISKNEILYTNDRAAGRSFTAQEMFAQVQKLASEGSGTLPKAFILSSRTRFGDTPCAGRSSEPRMTGLQEFIRLLKKEYPAIPVIVDASQSIGRNDLGEQSIKDLGCDIYVNSGGKALGIENVATLILRTKFPDSQPNWLNPSPEGKKDLNRDWLELEGLVHDDNPRQKLQPGRATENAIGIAEMGMMMQYLTGKVDAWSTNAISQNTTLREVTAQHMRNLTAHFLKRAEEYHKELLPAFQNLSLGNENLEDASYAEQFGCQVIYPVHRSFKDYNGIVTVTFPNIVYTETDKEGQPKPRFNYLAKELEKYGYKALLCLQDKERGMRFSFNMAQTTEDIDALFDTIRTIHIDFLRKHEGMRSRSIKTFTDLRAQTANVPTDWMPA